ncbi:MAG TPA: DUF1801 domain-containing protein [Candidatus Saccharimonadales bacterium]|nr:DUF1801 domain-containing protein [Candidatus Saccharimonadales bacterium]
MADKSASQQIDDIITNSDDWRGKMLAQLRAIILEADPAIIEEVKWKKPSKPEGVAVWSLDGNLCMVDILKNAVRINFPKGAQLKDTNKLFNMRLDSKTVRSIDFSENETVDKASLKKLVIQAVTANKDRKGS